MLCSTSFCRLLRRPQCAEPHLAHRDRALARSRRLGSGIRAAFASGETKMCAVLCCAAVCCVMLCYVVLCCVVLCCVVLCCVVLCCAQDRAPHKVPHQDCLNSGVGVAVATWLKSPCARSPGDGERQKTISRFNGRSEIEIYGIEKVNFEEMSSGGTCRRSQLRIHRVWPRRRSTRVLRHDGQGHEEFGGDQG